MNNQELSKVFQEEPTTTRTLRNIRNSLRDRLKELNVISEEEINDMTDEIMRIHGLHKDNFDFIKNTEILINEKLNDASIDDNSNKNEKTVSGIMAEVTKSADKAIGYDYLYKQLVDDYGKKEAKRLTGLIYDYSLALSDSTNILKCYCWAFDASKIVFFGRPFGQLKSKPPKKVMSYISALNETIHQFSNHLAGACAISSLFMDVAYLLIEREGYTLKQVRKDEQVRKYVENCFQSFVHSVNHLSRLSSESPFTNVSIFDRSKLEVMLDDENYGWVFEYFKDKSYDKEYVINFIEEVQNIFLNFFDKGDPSSNGLPYRFPVVTLNVSKNKEGHILDDNFVKNITNRDIYRYNLFVSEGQKIASCCRLLSDNEMMSFGEQVNSFGAGASFSIGSHRVLTLNYNRLANECTNYDDFIAKYLNRIEDAIRILKSHKNLLQRLTDVGLQSFIEMKWIDINRLFSTIGIIGQYEAQITLQKRFKGCKDKDLIHDWLVILNDKVKALSKEYETIINIEQIPGESMAVRLANTDKLIYGSKVPFKMYANQFIPLWEDATIYERMEIDGKYNRLITGGGIVHFNLGEKVTPKQAEKLIHHAVESGASHFALNAKYNRCENNHFSFGNQSKCPECEGQIVDVLVRVIGYFSPVSSWNKVRREWEFPKRNFNGID